MAPGKFRIGRQSILVRPVRSSLKSPKPSPVEKAAPAIAERRHWLGFYPLFEPHARDQVLRSGWAFGTAHLGSAVRGRNLVRFEATPINSGCPQHGALSEWQLRRSARLRSRLVPVASPPSASSVCLGTWHIEGPSAVTVCPDPIVRAQPPRRCQRRARPASGRGHSEIARRPLPLEHC